MLLLFRTPNDNDPYSHFFRILLSRPWVRELWEYPMPRGPLLSTRNYSTHWLPVSRWGLPVSSVFCISVEWLFTTCVPCILSSSKSGTSNKSPYNMITELISVYLLTAFSHAYRMDIQAYSQVIEYSLNRWSHLIILQLFPSHLQFGVVWLTCITFTQPLSSHMR